MFKLFLTSLAICLCTYTGSMAQIITLSGKVTDQKTSTTLPGVTIKTGNYGTSTNADGVFYLVVDKAIAQQNGITATCIGYQKIHLAFSGMDYQIKLIPAANALKEVVISGNGETILQKAIRRIPENYPSKNFMMTGILQMLHTAKDSTAYRYYYKNEALLNIYYPNYTDPDNKPQVSLVKKKDTLSMDPGSEASLIRWIGGYTNPVNSDYVHHRAGILGDKQLKHYTSVMNGKDIINGHRVYVINFFAKGKSENAGTLYIDTASYAFVRITRTSYHIASSFTIPIDKASHIIDYREVAGKWQLYSTKTNSIARHGDLLLYRTEDFLTTNTDTANAKPLPYASVIAHFTEDAKVTPKAGSAAIVMPTPVNDTIFTKIAVPVIDTTPPKRKGLFGAYQAFSRYVFNDNIRQLFELSTLPASAVGYQPVLDKTLGNVSTYVIGINTQFRLYKGLFAQVDGKYNWGIGGIKNNEGALYLIYNFELNKSGHPITFQPLFGTSEITLSHKGDKLLEQSCLVSGFNFAYEYRHNTSLFLSAKYYSRSGTATNNGLSINFQPVVIGGGILFRLKL